MKYPTCSTEPVGQSEVVCKSKSLAKEHIIICEKSREIEETE